MTPVDERVAEAIVELVQQSTDWPDISHLAAKADVRDMAVKADLRDLVHREDLETTNAAVSDLRMELTPSGAKSA